MKNYFENCKTLEELKAEYKKLALIHHPDRGGDTATMQAINAAFEQAHARLKDTHATKDGETYTKETNEAPAEFMDIINELVKMDGVIIEVVGSFLWLSGNTKEHKEAIKALGFRWSKNKLMWYKAPSDYKKRSRETFTMDDIRGMFGSAVYSAPVMISAEA